MISKAIHHLMMIKFTFSNRNLFITNFDFLSDYHQSFFPRVLITERLSAIISYSYNSKLSEADWQNLLKSRIALSMSKKPRYLIMP